MIYQFSRKPKLSYQDMVGKNELMQMHWSVKCLEEMNRFLQTAFVDCIEFICFIDLIKLSFYLFFPRHQISKHLLYLQLRHDILEERILCDEDQCVELSALALQAEYGDYDPESMGKNYFLQEHYFPHRVVKRLGSVYIRDHATEEHRKLAGSTDRQAEIEFIKVRTVKHLNHSISLNGV